MSTEDVRDTLIRDIITHSPEIISVKRSETVGQALQRLVEEHISVLGVLDDGGDCFIGLITAFDIMTYIALAGYKEDEEPSEIKAKHTLETPVGDVTGVFHSETNRIWSFEEDMPIVKVLEPMSKGVHRTVIVTANDTFKLLTQTDVIRWGIANKQHFKDTQKSLDELALGNPATSSVVSITTEQSALRGFKRMEMEQKTALPVVDPISGAVVTTLSASDIKKITADNISTLLKPVTEFLQTVNGGTRKPETAILADNLESVMHKLLDNKIHHVWVVDESNRPVAAVGCTDIINRLQGIDEDLQSRALAVYGRGAMSKLFETKVLISGVNGLGAEIAKNVILANVNSVTLHDTKPTTYFDLGSHFYLSENNIGQNRARSSQPKLAELNPSVRVTATDEELTEELIAQHNILILIETSNENAIRFNDFCRKKGISFIKTDVNGLAGYIFCDFGTAFTVVDTTGEQPATGIVKQITKDGRVQCLNDEHLGLQDGDFVTFSEVKGMVELNDREFQIERTTPFSFFIKDIEGFSDYISGGIVLQVKKEKVIDFDSFENQLKSLGFVEPPDYSKFDRPAVLHTAFKALDKFKSAKQRLPEPASKEDAEQLLQFFTEINDASEEKVEISDSLKSVLLKFGHGAKSVLNPMTATFGGIVGQEVTKAATGKFHPINQWFLFDAFEALPDELLDASEYKAQDSRYDNQIAVFGKTFQEEFLNQNYFLVGAGALGCEFLKNFAMTGLGCGPKGRVTVTDDDIIEKSNLSRQFLFRNWQVKQSKSKCASDSAKQMNPNLNVVAKQERVQPSTENIFNEEFWNGLNGVCGALDNIKARLYVDQRCILYERPYLESGTLGPKCHSQVIIPHKTQHYGAQPDQPEKEAPVCILHNFPHNIQHCLTWGRSEFNGNFEVAPNEVSNFLTNENYIQSLKDTQVSEGDIKEKLIVISKTLNNLCTSFEDCIRWARLEFQENFFNKISELIYNFPEDATTSTGNPFWAPPKRFPRVVNFNPDDATHMSYIISAANLRAKSFNIPRPKTNRKPDYFKEILATVAVPDFVPSKKKIQTDENERVDDDLTIAGLLEKIPDPKSVTLSVKMTAEEFEKDDDTNFHMDFIAAGGNLRARNYGIEEVDKLKAKLIAGRIIPAIATATALATGLVMIEIYKLVNKRPTGDFSTVGSYRCSSINLALPQFSFFEPLTPEQFSDHVEKIVPDPINHPEYVEEEDIVAYPPNHTIWDKIHVRLGTEFTLQEFNDYFKKDHGIEVSMLSILTRDGKARLVFGTSLKNTHVNLPRKFFDVVAEKTGEDVRKQPFFIPEILFTKDGDTVVNPPVLVHSR